MALGGLLAANSSFGESRFANRIGFSTESGASNFALYGFPAIKIKFFSRWTRREKNATHARQNNQYGPKIEKIPPSVVICEALTRQLEAAIRDEKGLVSDVERDAAAACHGIPSSWHGIVNRYPYIASAHAKAMTKSQHADARSLANG